MSRTDICWIMSCLCHSISQSLRHRAGENILLLWGMCQGAQWATQCAIQGSFNKGLALAEGGVVGREPSSVSTFRKASSPKEPRQPLFNDC